MMILFVWSSLILVSAIVAVVLAAAWYALDRPVHALLWAASFVSLAAMGSMDLLARIAHPASGAVGAPMLAFAGAATTLNTLAFRRRAGKQKRTTGLAGAALLNALLVTLLAMLGAPPAIRAIPLGLLNAGMFVLAQSALTGQRRKAERAAARAAQATLSLLGLFNALLLAGMIAAAIGRPVFDLGGLIAAAMLLMPAFITSIGLAAIILIAADLADRARRLAATDMLTGLLNRRGFEEAGRALLARARLEGRPMAVVMIDVDRFKQVNDAFGHPAGDGVLRQIAAALAGGGGARDIAARLGGEEFALAIGNADLAAACRAAEALRRAVAAIATELGRPYVVTASFGVAELRDADADLEDLVRRADEALYRAKAGGRNCVREAP